MSLKLYRKSPCDWLLAGHWKYAVTDDLKGASYRDAVRFRLKIRREIKTEIPIGLPRSK
jgi:hypothetical protein